MAEINFPDAPAQGQTHTEAGTTWVWSDTPAPGTWTVVREGVFYTITNQRWTASDINIPTTKGNIFTSDPAAGGQYLVACTGAILATASDQVEVFLESAGFTLQTYNITAGDNSGQWSIPFSLVYAGAIAAGFPIELEADSSAGSVALLKDMVLTATRTGP